MMPVASRPSMTGSFGLLKFSGKKIGSFYFDLVEFMRRQIQIYFVVNFVI